MHYPLNGDLGRSQAIPKKDIGPPKLEIKRLSVDNSRRLIRSRLIQFAIENDVCARLGGDEFVLLVNTNTS